MAETMINTSSEENKKTIETKNDFSQIGKICNNAAFEIESFKLSQKENYSKQNLQGLVNWLEHESKNIEESLEIIKKSLLAAHITAEDEKTELSTEIDGVVKDLNDFIANPNLFRTQYKTKTEALFEFCKALTYFFSMN